MTKKRKPQKPRPPDDDIATVNVKNSPLHIPLDFDKAVEGLLNVKQAKPKKDKDAK